MIEKTQSKHKIPVAARLRSLRTDSLSLQEIQERTFPDPLETEINYTITKVHVLFIY